MNILITNVNDTRVFLVYLKFKSQTILGRKTATSSDQSKSWKLDSTKLALANCNGNENGLRSPNWFNQQFI